MRLSHFHQLRPLCLACRSREPELESALTISHAIREDQEDVLEGLLRCGNAGCQYEYPIIDGIPYLLPNLPEFLAANVDMLRARTDLSSQIQSVLSDCCGPDAGFNITQQHLSSYGWCHYADLDPRNDDSEAGSTARVLAQMLRPTIVSDTVSGPVVDLGCSVGRNTLDLAAQTGRLTLGIDLNVAMLRMASTVLRTGRVRFPLRRGGVVYDQVDFPAEFEGSENADFWACDATNLPFANATFSECVSHNTLDSVASPVGLLQSIARSLLPDGIARVACPYDWTTSVTQIQSWIGGHSQRADHNGRSEDVLRQILNSQTELSRLLQIIEEYDDLPWVVRVHDRSRMSYRLHGVMLQRSGNETP